MFFHLLGNRLYVFFGFWEIANWLFIQVLLILKFIFNHFLISILFLLFKVHTHNLIWLSIEWKDFLNLFWRHFALISLFYVSLLWVCLDSVIFFNYIRLTSFLADIIFIKLGYFLHQRFMLNITSNFILIDCC